MRKDTNFLLAKRNIAFLGGRLTMITQNKRVYAQLIMPLEADVVLAVLDERHCDHQFWKMKNKTTFSQFRQNLKATIQELSTIKYGYTRQASGKTSKQSKNDICITPLRLGISSKHKFDSEQVANYANYSNGFEEAKSSSRTVDEQNDSALN